MLQRVAIRIEGSVQGVFFRDSAKRKADELGIAGWVRNESDGSVGIEAEGDNAPLQKFIEWCRRGPPAARVEKVNVEQLQPEQADSFLILQ